MSDHVDRGGSGHAQIGTKRRGTAEPGSGPILLVDVRGLAMHGNLAEELAGMRLVTASGVGARELEEAFGLSARLLHAADEEQGLAQPGKHKRMEEHAAPGGNALQRLVQNWQGPCSTPGKG